MFDRRRAALAALAAVPLLLLASACKDDGSSPFGMNGSGGGGGAAAGVSTAPSSNGSPLGSGGTEGTGGTESTGGTEGTGGSGSGDASALSGTWEGRYTCQQGGTTMRLHLSGLNDKVTGTFDFGGGGVPAGSYTVSGTLADGKVTLTGGQWIKQPDGFGMVAFDVTSMSATALSGTVDGEGCTTFQVTKTSSD